MNIVARPWEPKDLIDDLQMLIDEEPDNYLNHRRKTMCMARDFLKEHFAEPRWISVEERLPEKQTDVLMLFENNMAVGYWFDGDEVVTFWRVYTDDGWCADCDCEPTHWMPLPEPPEVEV